jgi:hypothetical protein
MREILKQFTPNNVAGGSYERISIASLINGQMNMADAQDLLFNLIASFRVFLAIQS